MNSNNQWCEFEMSTIGYYSYCRTLRIKNFGKQRVVINYRHADFRIRLLTTTGENGGRMTMFYFHAM